MSLIYKCDICGKDSAMTGVTFSHYPMMLKKRNFEGKTFRIYVSINAEDEADHEKISEALGEASQLDNENELADFAKKLQLNTPYAMMCDSCKKYLAAEIVQKAKFQLDSPKLYSNSSKRIDKSGLDEMINNLAQVKNEESKIEIENLITEMEEVNFEDEAVKSAWTKLLNKLRGSADGA